MDTKEEYKEVENVQEEVKIYQIEDMVGMVKETEANLFRESSVAERVGSHIKIKTRKLAELGSVEIALFADQDDRFLTSWVVQMDEEDEEDGEMVKFIIASLRIFINGRLADRKDNDSYNNLLKGIEIEETGVSLRQEYKCFICSESYDYWTEMYIHIMDVHKSMPLYDLVLHELG